MRVATATLRSVSPYSQSRVLPLGSMKDKEKHDDYEKRIWRERLHVNAAGNVFIPPMAFKHCIASAAQYLSLSVPGKGTSKYTKHFLAGILVVEGLDTGIAKDAVEGEWLHMNSDGKKGGSKRVWRCYPKIENWAGDVEYLVLDDTITNEIFERVLIESGRFIGIGRFAPNRGGYYGRFAVDKVKWSEN